MAVSIINPAFITKVNSPNERRFIGRVKRIRTGFKNALTTPKAIAVTSAAKNVSTVTPGRIYAAAKMTKLETNHVIRISVSGE